MSSGLSFNWPIIGHEGISKFLQTSIVNKSLSHAYLFYGPDKVGKTTIAKLFAKSILCTGYKEYSSLATAVTDKQVSAALPCGECESCQQFEKGTYADFYLLEKEINPKTGVQKERITVNQIRDLQEKLNKRAFLNSYKIVIIRNAESFTKEASNSLLKTLEEPPAKTILILLTSVKELMLETILSRVQMFKFLPITRDSIYEYLTGQGLGRTISSELASLSQGRPTVALSYAKKLDEFEALKTKNSDWLNVFKQNGVERFVFIDKLLAKKPSVNELLKELNSFSSLIRDLILVNHVNSNLLSHSYLEEDFTRITQRYSMDRLVQIIKKVEETKKYLKQNINAKLALENLIINI